MKRQAGERQPVFDVIIVGGGPAGLSAALLLGRCRRRILVCDAGRPRNRASQAMHGFLTRDGIPPAEFLRVAREQLARYETISLIGGEVVAATCGPDRFDVQLRDGASHSSRMLLLATGVVDELPPIDGIEPLYGRSVFHCPYCDGWEVRDQPLAMYKRNGGAEAALELSVWSGDVVLCTDGPADITDKERVQLTRRGIRVHEGRIARLEGKAGLLDRIVFADGARLPRRALFFSSGARQHSPLAASLGCDFDEKDTVDTRRRGSTNVPGLFVVGDATGGIQMVIVAAAEGARAAETINAALLEAELERGEPRSDC